jgi:hypothetical protein
MTVALSSKGLGELAILITGAVSAANGGLGNFANPEGVKCIILRATFYGITNSVGAANLGVGVEASGEKATDILNDLAMAAVLGKMYNGHVMQNGAKTEITAPVIWAADKFITFTGSADTTGLTGILFVEYIRVE